MSRRRPTPVYLEVGAKRVFAGALDWPGWIRSAKTPDDAVDALATYAPRYSVATSRAGVAFPLALADAFDVVEELPGSAGTDFGVPGDVPQHDHRPLTTAAARRQAAIVRASWDVLDDVVAHSPEHLRKGPRGGGRDRDAIAAHVVAAEQSYARKLGVRRPPPKDRDEVDELRAAIVDVLAHASKGDALVERGWPPRYAARRVAWHALDHAWEIEDRRTGGDQP